MYINTRIWLYVIVFSCYVSFHIYNKLYTGNLQAGAAIMGFNITHYGNVIMGAIVSEITSLMIVYSTVYSDADQRKHQSSTSLAFVTGEFPTQMASNVENDSIWWRHHDDIPSSTAVTECEQTWEIKMITDTPYPTLMGNLWHVSCKDLTENWLFSS